MMADERERKIRDSKAVINDPNLQRYLHDVLCRAVGEARCGGIRIYVVRNAEVNASMAPNGMLVIYTGLLLLARNEAELAGIIGHEFAHFELRHGLRGFKHERTETDIFAWAGVAAGLAATYGSGQSRQDAIKTSQSIQADAVGSIYAFTREQERDADLLSMAYLQSSKYNPACFADIWRRLMDEADATARGRKQRSTRYDRVGFFATHPTSLDRATYLRDIAASTGKTGEDDSARYSDELSIWRTQFLGDQVKLNDFEGTDYLIGQLVGSAWTGDLLYARAELYRARGNPRDLISAIGFYREAIQKDPSNADLYRGIGLAEMRGKDPDGAENLKKYLAMKPDAEDRAMISTLLQ